MGCRERGVIQTDGLSFDNFMAQPTTLVGGMEKSAHGRCIDGIARVPSFCPECDFKRAIELQFEPLQIIARGRRCRKGCPDIRPPHRIKRSGRVPYRPAQEAIAYQVSPSIT